MIAMHEELHDTEVSDLLLAGAALGDAKEHSTPDALPYAVVPAGCRIERLPVAETPKRNAFTARMGDAASFITYVADHAGDNTRLYATLKPAVFLALFDDVAIDNEPAWRGWRCEYAPQFSREWATWMGADKRKFTQTEFAEFLQDNLPDVVKPPGAELLELALNFEASINGTFVSAQRMDNGNVNFSYRVDTAQAAHAVQMPSAIALALPVFEGDALREMQARLKWRIEQGKLTISYEIVRPHKVMEQAFMDTWARIAEGTNMTILRGRPE